MRNWQPGALDQAGNPGQIVELAWQRLGGDAVLLAYNRDGQRYSQALDNVSPRFSAEALIAGVNRVGSNAKIESTVLLDSYDSYYYPRHHQGLVEKPLPVVQVKLADDDDSLFYLDPRRTSFK